MYESRRQYLSQKVMSNIRIWINLSSLFACSLVLESTASSKRVYASSKRIGRYRHRICRILSGTRFERAVSTTTEFSINDIITTMLLHHLEMRSECLPFIMRGGEGKRRSAWIAFKDADTNGPTVETTTQPNLLRMSTRQSYRRRLGYVVLL